MREVTRDRIPEQITELSMAIQTNSIHPMDIRSRLTIDMLRFRAKDRHLLTRLQQDPGAIADIIALVANEPISVIEALPITDYVALATEVASAMTPNGETRKLSEKN